jgi:DNA-binding transcriptional MerR regulator
METGLAVQEVADQTELSGYTIRYYKRIGLIPSIERAPNRHRRYSEENIGWIEFKRLRSTQIEINDWIGRAHETPALKGNA